MQTVTQKQIALNLLQSPVNTDEKAVNKYAAVLFENVHSKINNFRGKFYRNIHSYFQRAYSGPSVSGTSGGTPNNNNNNSIPQLKLSTPVTKTNVNNNNTDKVINKLVNVQQTNDKFTDLMINNLQGTIKALNNKFDPQEKQTNQKIEAINEQIGIMIKKLDGISNLINSDDDGNENIDHKKITSVWDISIKENNTWENKMSIDTSIKDNIGENDSKNNDSNKNDRKNEDKSFIFMNPNISTTKTQICTDCNGPKFIEDIGPKGLCMDCVKACRNEGVPIGGACEHCGLFNQPDDA
jgi:hypothetical protein